MAEPEQKPRVIDYGTPPPGGGWQTVVVRVCAFVASAGFAFGTFCECFFWEVTPWHARWPAVTATAAGSVICLLIGVFANRRR